MPEQTEQQQQSKDAAQNAGAPASATDELTHKELDQTTGGAHQCFGGWR